MTLPVHLVLLLALVGLLAALAVLRRARAHGRRRTAHLDDAVDAARADREANAWRSAYEHLSPPRT